jgi:hypothetical protein
MVVIRRELPRTKGAGPAITAYRIATQLGLFGWSVHRTGTGVFAVGPEVKIRLVPAGARAGMKQIELRLRRPVLKLRIQLGNAELRLRQHWPAGLMEVDVRTELHKAVVGTPSYPTI